MNWARLYQNLLTIVLNPKIGFQYFYWIACRSLNAYPTIKVKLRGRIEAVSFKLGAWTSFTEFHQRAHGIDPDDCAAIELCCGKKNPKDNSTRVAIDVGANIGCFSLALSAAGFNVVAFEPISESRERLLNNLRLNPGLSERIELQEYAVGENIGEVAFAIFPGSSEQNKIADAIDVDSNVGRRIVEMTTLDCFCLGVNIHRIVFLKIDVEGFELQVLRGCRRLFDAGAIENVYLELIPEALINAQASVREVCEFLSGNGFMPHLSGAFETESFSVEFLQSHMSQSRNVLWRHRSVMGSGRS